MITPQQHLETIGQIYVAFGKGDVPTILNLISEDVDWEFGTPNHGIPWLQPGHGKAAAERFFGAVATELNFRRFEILSVMGDGPWVVALIRLEAIAQRTGRTFREECEVHVWRFDIQGKVAAFRHAADTHSHWLALQA